MHPPSRHRFSYLLLAEFALIVGYPALQYVGIGPLAWQLLSIGVFAAALYAAMGEGRLTAIAVLLGAAAIVGNILNSIGGGTYAFSLPGQVFGAIFLVFVTTMILRSVIAAATVTVQTLYGAIAAYVLMGVTWGSVYFLIETIWPVSFRSTVMPGSQLSGGDFIFFSFVTLTTIGYGNVVPASGMAQSFVIIEAVTGIMYPAVMIGRLIALHSVNPREPGKS